MFPCNFVRLGKFDTNPLKILLHPVKYIRRALVGNGSKLHEDKFAQEDKITQKQFGTYVQFRTEGHFCTKVKKTKNKFKIKINKNKKKVTD